MLSVNYYPVFGAIAFALLTCGCGNATATINDESAERETYLSRNESLGAVFLSGRWLQFEVLSRCDRTVRPELRSLLKDYPGQNPSDRVIVHSNVTVMLGYVGDETDVKALEKALWEEITSPIPEYRPVRGEPIWTVPLALALMSSRGIEEATEVLDRMTSYEYWTKQKIHVFNPDKVSNYEPHHDVGYAMRYALEAQMIAGDSDARAVLRKMLASVPNKELQDELRDFINLDGLEEIARRYVTGPLVEPRDEDLDTITELYKTRYVPFRDSLGEGSP